MTEQSEPELGRAVTSDDLVEYANPKCAACVHSVLGEVRATGIIVLVVEGKRTITPCGCALRAFGRTSRQRTRPYDGHLHWLKEHEPKRTPHPMSSLVLA